MVRKWSVAGACRVEMVTHFLDDGIVGGGGIVADAVDDLEGLLGLGVDSVVGLVVLVKEPVR